MAHAYADRVKETSITTGTGTYNLDGAVTGFRTFVAGIGTGNTCPYVATNGTDWEVGEGTVTDATPDTLARTTIRASSNGGAAVSWAAGSKDIFCSLLGADIDVDTTLAANSDQKLATQKALKAYADTKLATGYAVNKYSGPATWTKPTGLKAVRVRVQATGGAGGGGVTPALIGGGGGAGGFADGVIPAPTLPGPVPVAVPAPGTTSFGTFLTATVGGVGGTQPSVTAGVSGVGAGPAADAISRGKTQSTVGSPGLGRGADSDMGIGGSSVAPPAGVGGNATGFGAGGGAGKGGPVPAPSAGGTGAPAQVIVEEFY